MRQTRPRLGQLLVDARILTPEQLEQVLELQKVDGRRLGTLLVEIRLVTETQLTQILSQQLSVPWVSLYHIDFSRELLSLVPRETADRYCLVPIYVRPVRGLGDTLYVAMDDPMNEEALLECSRTSGLPTRAMIAAPTDIRKAVRIYYGGARGAQSAAKMHATPSSPVQSANTADTAEADTAGEADAEGVESQQTAQQGASSIPELEADAYSASVSTVPDDTPTEVEAVMEPSGEATAQPSLSDAAAPVEGEESAAQLNAGGEANAAGRIAAIERPSSGADDAPDLFVREVEVPRKRRAKRLSLTLLDGTTIALGPARTRPKPDQGTASAAEIVEALRGACRGKDPRDVLGDEVRWEKFVAAILNLLIRKHLILDREFIEEIKKI